MSDLSLEQVEDLRQLQLQLNANNEIYMSQYKRIIKTIYTKQLSNLMKAEFNVEDVKLNIPQLPPLPAPQDYTPMFQLSKMEELYEATTKGLSML